MRGTWQTTDGGGGAGVLLVIGAVLLLGSGGAVAAVSAAVIDALIAVAAVTALAVVGLSVFLVHRLRNPSPEGFVRTLPGAAPHELPGRQQPAIEQHVHFHFGPGADPRAVAEILAEHKNRPPRPD